MNILWGMMILISIVFSFLNANVSETLNAGFSGAASAFEVALSFAGVMCLWTGLLRVAEFCGMSDILRRLLSPVIRFLFPKLDKKSKAAEFITLNVTANMLGLGNGATPMGIKAMKELDDKSGMPTDEMCMFIVLNTTAFQLIPTSILALRSGFGSENPFSVIVPIWITSFVALSVSVICVKLMCKMRRKG